MDSKLLQDINTLKYTYRGLDRYLVNTYFALTDFCDFNDYGSVFCPFHDDESGGKPSAKFYLDEDGIQRLYCFSERRQFTAFDYIKLLLNQDPLFYLVNNVPSEEIRYTIKEYMSGLGTTQIRQSKLKSEDIAKLNEQQFIDVLCFGTTILSIN